MNNYAHSQDNFRKRHIEGDQDSALNSRILYEDVVRKNQEIIKQILAKINDLFSKQEDFDCSIRSINKKITRISETAEQLQHQFRANHVELQRKHQGLINDISGLKGDLKISDLDYHHEKYLQSQFFKYQSAMVSIRSRSRRKMRHKTNFKRPQDDQKFEQFQKTENSLSPHLNGKVKRFSQLKKVENIQKKSEDFFQELNKNQPSNTFVGIQSKDCQQYRKIEALIDQKIRQMQHKLQFCLNNSKGQMKINQLQLNQEIKKLESIFEIKSLGVSKNVVKQKIQNQTNFQQINSYLQDNYKEKLHEQISKSYFQESLSNLQQSWQKELNKIYDTIDTKIGHQTLQIMNGNIAELRTQLQKFSNLNSIKAYDYSYNSNDKSMPQAQSLTERKNKSNIYNHAQTSRQEESKLLKRNDIMYSNSYSSFSRNKDFKNIVFEQKNCILKNDEESVAKWKNRAMQTLGLTHKKGRKMK